MYIQNTEINLAERKGGACESCIDMGLYNLGVKALPSPGQCHALIATGS